MFVKLSGNVWLVLTAVVVFPVMLYVTRQVPQAVDGQAAEQVGGNQAETVQVSGRENKQAALPVNGKAAPATPTENFAKASNSYSDPADSLDVSSDTRIDKSVSPAPRREEAYQDDTELALQPEIYARESAKSAIESPPVNTATVNYYSVGSTAVAPETASPMAAKSSAVTGTTGSNHKQTGSSTVASVDNSILSPLYTAKIQAPPKIKPKCPPVYMAVNAYARNMRIAMGCNDNP